MSGASSWSFREEDYRRIQTILTDFLRESSARTALIVDRTGQLVATVGEPPAFDPTAFATLTAADFSANDQLARMLGEPADEGGGAAAAARAHGASSCRATSAWARVTPSTNSRSPPIGSPRASRVTRTPRPARSCWM